MSYNLFYCVDGSAPSAAQRHPFVRARPPLQRAGDRGTWHLLAKTILPNDWAPQPKLPKKNAELAQEGEIVFQRSIFFCQNGKVCCQYREKKVLSENIIHITINRVFNTIVS